MFIYSPKHFGDGKLKFPVTQQSLKWKKTYSFTFSHWQFTVLFLPVMLLEWADRTWQGRPVPQIDWFAILSNCIFCRCFFKEGFVDFVDFEYPWVHQYVQIFKRVKFKNGFARSVLFAWCNSTELSERAFTYRTYLNPFNIMTTVLSAAHWQLSSCYIHTVRVFRRPFPLVAWLSPLLGTCFVAQMLKMHQPDPFSTSYTLSFCPQRPKPILPILGGRWLLPSRRGGLQQHLCNSEMLQLQLLSLLLGPLVGTSRGARNLPVNSPWSRR